MKTDDAIISWIAHWCHGSNYHRLRFQDAKSRKLIEAVRKKASELEEAIKAAYDYSGYREIVAAGGPFPNETDEKVNVCQSFVSYDLKAENPWALQLIRHSAERALRFGHAPVRGRPPLLAYYSFIHGLYLLYHLRTRKNGFYEKNGAAEGPFIDLVVEAQKILPDNLRLNERTTIANRVLQAFTVKIPD